MASEQTLSIQCTLPDGRKIGSSEIDGWELKAAYRALLNLKTLLYEQPILDLLAQQIQEGDTYFKDLIAKSDGRFTESRVDFSVQGLTSGQFLSWFKSIGAKSAPESVKRLFLDIMAPAHPEHYALGPYSIGIVETIGGHICRVRIDNAVEVPDFVREYGDPAFEHKLPVTCYLDDGTVFFYGYQEIRDRDNGCDFRFRIIFPAASPKALLEEHVKHLAIEFKSWIAAAFRSCQK